MWRQQTESWSVDTAGTTPHEHQGKRIHASTSLSVPTCKPGNYVLDVAVLVGW